jgi:CRISPR/Cas system CSM-associated protein Csm3 (group 7 of RAMP superfamily)
MLKNFVKVDLSRWQISGILTCHTPLRVGDGSWLNNRISEKDLSENQVSPEVAGVFTMPDEGNGLKPYIPGSSLKGWLRSFAERVWEDSPGRERIDILFGQRKDGALGGALEFHDAPLSSPVVFDNQAPRDWDALRKTCLAPHVKINPLTRTAEHNMLFFEEFVPEGSEFKVTITAERIEPPHLRCFLDLLAAFENHCPSKLGGCGSDSYGDVRWRRTALKGLTAEDYDEWLKNPDRLLSDVLADCEPAELDPVGSAIAPSRRWLEFNVTIEMNGGFVSNDPFGAQPKRYKDPNSPLADVAPRCKPSDVCFLPASSVRGCLRSQAERIQRTLNTVVPDKKVTVNTIKEASQLDLTAKLFGAPGWRSLVQSSDFKAVGGVPYRQEFVAIDRFTGGAARNKKFNADALWKPTLRGQIRVDIERLRLVIQDFESVWTLLYFILRDLADGFITLGHGAAKGFGACTATIEMSEPEAWGHEFNGPAFRKLHSITAPISRFFDGPAPNPPSPVNRSKGHCFNPYHFIPVTQNLNYAESEPSHALYQEDRHHGRIYCQLRTLTSLFIGAQRSQEGEHPRQVPPATVPGTRNCDQGYPGDPIVWASSLRGLISSFSEAASNSALRVLDNPLAYSRRALVSPVFDPRLNESLSAIGVLVRRGKNGNDEWYVRPLCLPARRNGDFEPVWQPAFPTNPQLKIYTEMMPAISSWRPGDPAVNLSVVPYHWDGRGIQPEAGLKIRGVILGGLEHPGAAPVPGVYRILGREGRQIPRLKKHELWLPFPDVDTFKIEGEWDSAESQILFPVTREALVDFQLLADEMTEASREGEAIKPYEPIGTRPGRGRSKLKPQSGDLVYFELDGAQVKEISYSSVWRKKIEGTAFEFFAKVHPDLLPLGSNLRPGRRLTIAEAMFGVTESREEESSEPLYAVKSRIRFSNGIWQGESGKALWLPPASPKILSSPKPPSPTMYFKNDAGAATICKRDLNIHRHRPQGRKFYLHHQQANWRAFPQPKVGGEHADQYVRIRPLDSDQLFQFWIDFENLTEKELGLLLQALRPEDKFAHKLGMGKSHGLGSVQITVLHVATCLPGIRYMGLDGPDNCWDELREWPGFSAEPEIARAITALGCKAYAGVQYPVARNLSDSNAGLRDKVFEWFVANELGSKSRDESQPPALKNLEPIADFKVTGLPYLDIWPSGQEEDARAI